jgi:GTP 3',8-cyclase
MHTKRIFSLDTLDPFKFELMTRRQGHDAVLKCLDVALASSLESIKLNVVVVRGLNDSEVLDFVEMTRETRLSIRFIEFMPFTGEFPSAGDMNFVKYDPRK